MLRLQLRTFRLLALSVPMLLAAACADPDDDASEFSSALEGDAGARPDGAKGDAMLEAGAPEHDGGVADAGAPVVQMQLDDDRADADAGVLLGPATFVKVGQSVRATLPVTELCSTWGIQGGGDVAATLIMTDETRPDKTSVRHFTWKPSKRDVYTLRFVSGPKVLDKPLCSYSGMLIVN